MDLSLGCVMASRLSSPTAFLCLEGYSCHGHLSSPVGEFPLGDSSNEARSKCHVTPESTARRACDGELAVRELEETWAPTGKRSPRESQSQQRQQDKARNLRSEERRVGKECRS